MAGNSAGSGVIQVFLTLCGRQIVGVVVVIIILPRSLLIKRTTFYMFVCYKMCLYPTGLSRRGLLNDNTINENVGEMFVCVSGYVLSLLSDED